jgi:uncharacterized membrane protein YphA (DoxX/SURF4 family)
MNTMQQWKAWAEAHTDICLDFVRIYIGVGLVVKALGFILDKQYLMDLVSKSGDWFAPTLIVHYVIMAHLAGGLMLAFGVGTRIAAVVQIPVLIGAVFYVNLPRAAVLEFRQNLEFSGLILVLLCVFAVFGAGRLSADYYLFKRSAPQEPSVRPV